MGTSIPQHSKEVKNHEPFGHWEQGPHPCCSQQGWGIDTVVSSRGKSKDCFATFIERQTRLNVAIKLEMSRSIHELSEHFPKDTFKTYTVDRGTEFACDSQIEAE